MCSIRNNHGKRVIKTMQHGCKSLRFDKDNVWVKKHDPEFDVTMSSYDSLHLPDLLKQNISLHRDEHLSYFENISGPDSEKIKKT